MASVKAMFRASTVDAKQGVIYFQIIHNRVVRQLTTDYHIFSNEWDGKSIQTAGCDSERRNYLKTTGERIDWDLKLLRSIVNQLDNRQQRYTADDIIATFKQSSKCVRMWKPMKRLFANKPPSPSRLQRNRKAKPSPSRINNGRRITQTRNQNREPMASIKVKFRPLIADFLAELE